MVLSDERGQEEDELQNPQVNGNWRIQVWTTLSSTGQLEWKNDFTGVENQICAQSQTQFEIWKEVNVVKTLKINAEVK